MFCLTAINAIDVKYINKKTLLITLLCSGFFSVSSFAQASDKPFFNVSPTVCIIESQNKFCEFNIQVNFTLAPFKELCLEITNRPRYTQCYNSPGLINEHFKLKTTHSITVQLIDPLKNVVVKEQQLSIANYKVSDYRIKRRFGWSL